VRVQSIRAVARFVHQFGNILGQCNNFRVSVVHHFSVCAKMRSRESRIRENLRLSPEVFYFWRSGMDIFDAFFIRM
jgi:hypothetical protein